MEIPREVLEVIESLENAGFQAYLVGGAVRDLLLGREPKDYDVATDARPEQVAGLFPKVIPTGEKYGTVTVLAGERAVEVTTFRKDGAYSDGRRPESVAFADSLEEDVARRDFTVNALALARSGILVDHVGGLKDLHDGVIRAVGDPPSRFREDPLRMMRAIRFMSQLGMIIEGTTLNAIQDCSALIAQVSRERIRQELVGILTSNGLGLEVLRLAGFFEYTFPELLECVAFDQRSRHHDKDVYFHTLCTVECVPPRLNVRLAALLHDVAKPKTFAVDANGEGHFYGHHLEGARMAGEMLRRLKFDNQTVAGVTVLVSEHMSRYPSLGPGSAKRLIARVGVENLRDLFDLQIADIAASKPPHDFSQVYALKGEVERILNHKEPLSVRDLAVNGYDLMEWGVKPGKEMGKALKTMLERVLDNPSINTREGLRGVFDQIVLSGGVVGLTVGDERCP